VIEPVKEFMRQLLEGRPLNEEKMMYPNRDGDLVRILSCFVPVAFPHAHLVEVIKGS
jgi:hypothetical protein